MSGRPRKRGRSPLERDVLWQLEEAGRENVTAMVAHACGLIEMDDGRRKKPEAAMPVLLVVPTEERLRKGAAVLE